MVMVSCKMRFFERLTGAASGVYDVMHNVCQSLSTLGASKQMDTSLAEFGRMGL